MTNNSKAALPDNQPAPVELEFQSDKGASVSTWIAAALVLALVGWMGSGFVIPSESSEETPIRKDPDPASVATRTSTAETVTQYYQAEGQALPDRDTKIRSTISGDVVEVSAKKGDDVLAGQVIAFLDGTNNTSDLKRAAEELERAQREYHNAEELLKRGVSTMDRVSQARATLANAQAQMTAAEEAQKDLSITAPFAGRIENLDINEGEFVSAGSEIARIVDITPLSVSIQIPQQSVTRISVGQTAKVRFITGQERDGKVVFIGSSASSDTRTFLAEIEVPNDDGSLSAGISAEVTIPTGSVTAHFVSPSIISLDADGSLGVKTVGSENIVEFHPIDIVKAQVDGIWVTGLPETANIITIGQGFVRADEIVVPSAGDKDK